VWRIRNIEELGRRIERQNETKKGGHTSEMKRRNEIRKRTKLLIKQTYTQIKLSGEIKYNGKG
jgi:hypothetical protein